MDIETVGLTSRLAVKWLESAELETGNNCYFYDLPEPLAGFIIDTWACLRLERNSGPISSLVAHYVDHGRLPDTSDPGATAAILPK